MGPPKGRRAVYAGHHGAAEEAPQGRRGASEGRGSAIEGRGGRHVAAALYTIWACELSHPSNAVRDFQEYARRRDGAIAREEVEQPAPKRARGPREREPAAAQTSSMECKICMDRPIEVLLLPCKHLVCCQVCGALSSTCPVCRGRVRENIRVYMG